MIGTMFELIHHTSKTSSALTTERQTNLHPKTFGIENDVFQELRITFHYLKIRG